MSSSRGGGIGCFTITTSVVTTMGDGAWVAAAAGWVAAEVEAVAWTLAGWSPQPASNIINAAALKMPALTGKVAGEDDGGAVKGMSL